MPIVRPNSYVTPPLPTTVTSSDGRITVMTDTVWDGVWIKADYRDVVDQYPAPFTAEVWRINYDGTQEKVRSGDPAMDYSGLLYAYDHEAKLGRSSQYYIKPVSYSNQALGMLDDARWFVSASNSDVSHPPQYAIDSSGNSTNWTSGISQYNGMYYQIIFNEARTFDSILMDTGPFTTDYPANYKILISDDGVSFNQVTTGSGSGQLTVVSFTGVTAKYLRIQLTSTHPLSSWWTIGNISVSSSTGKDFSAYSSTAAITIPARRGGAIDPALWLKSLEVPSYSLRLNAQATGEGTFSGTSSPQLLLGNQFPAVTLHQRTARNTSITVLTFNMDDFDKMERLTNTNLILLQSPPGFSRKDGYFYINKASYARVGLTDTEVFSWSLELVEIDRPATTNQTLSVPNYSYDDDGQNGDGLGMPPDRATYGLDGAYGPYVNIFDSITSEAMSTSGWTLTGTGAPSFPSTTQYYYNAPVAGLLQSGNTGTAGVTNSKKWGVVPLQPYTATIRIMPLDRATTCTLSLAWYTSGNSLISTDTFATTVRSLDWQYVGINAIAPSTATQVVMSISVNTIGVGQQFVLDTAELVYGAMPVLAETENWRNQLSVNKTSFDVSTADWTPTGGNTSYAQASSPVKDGIKSLAATAIGNGSVAITASADETVSASRKYRFRMWMNPTAASITGNAYIDWKTSGGTLIRTDTVSVALSKNLWNKLEIKATSPINAGKAMLRWDANTITAGQIVYADLHEFGPHYDSYIGPNNAYGYTYDWAPL